MPSSPKTNPSSAPVPVIVPYWDSLSTVHLTRGALKEFDRRKREAGLIMFTFVSGFDLNKDSAALQESLSQIKRSARIGGPDLTNLRGCPELPEAAAHITPPDTLVNPTAQPTRTETSVYSVNFEQNLIDNAIDTRNFEQIPANWDEIQRAISQPRPSHLPSEFSDSAFDAFSRAKSKAKSKVMVMKNIWPTIIGKSNIFTAGGIPFGNLKPLIDNKPLAVPKPDFYDGIHRDQIVSRLRREPATYIVPSTEHEETPVLPNFFAEFTGDSDVARRQAGYDGTFGARGIQKLRTFGQEGVEMLYDNKAYTITSSYHYGLVLLYTIHPSSSNDSEKPVYYMTLLRACLLFNAKDFQQEINAVRNARDWARAQRDKLLAAANRRASVAEPPDHQSMASLHKDISQLHTRMSSNHDLLPADDHHLSSHHDLVSADHDRLSALQSQLPSAQVSLSSSQNGRSSPRNRLTSDGRRRSSRYSPYRIPTPKHSHLSAKGNPLAPATTGLVNDGILSQSTVNNVVSGLEVLPQSEVVSERKSTNSHQPSRRSRPPSTRTQSSRNSR
ncbi:hypothetical protein MMC07_000857 [Pseudocyphellaria aurata]|nr:hypothetical protein [Pseudocyphellaria aurata]